MVHGGLGLSLTLFDGALPFPSSNGRLENALASNNCTAPQCLADCDQLDTGRAIAQPLAPVIGPLISENQKGINPLKMILHATNGGAVAQSRDWI
jgi:hypothetical protein